MNANEGIKMNRWSVLFSKLLLLIFLWFLHAVRGEVFDGLRQSSAPLVPLAQYAFQAHATQDNIAYYFSIRTSQELFAQQTWFLLIFDAYEDMTLSSLNRPYTSHCRRWLDKATAFRRLDLMNQTTSVREGREDGVTNKNMNFVELQDSWRLNMKKNGNKWLALANCNPNCTSLTEACYNGIHVTYQVTLRNEDANFTPIHMSLDETNLFTIYLSNLVIQIAIFLYSEAVRHKLRSLKKLHATVNMLSISIAAECISSSLFLSYYSALSRDGRRRPLTWILAHISYGVSYMSLLLLLMLLIKGWTIVRRKISVRGRIKIAFMSTLFFCIYWVVFAWEEIKLNPMDVYAPYTTGPSIILLILQWYLFFWFIYASYITMVSRYRKQGFYKKFIAITSFYLLTHAMFAPMIQLLLPDYQKEAFLATLRHITLTLVQGMLALLYDPRGLFRTSFPFHASTSHMLGKGLNSDKNPVIQEKKAKTTSPSASSLSVSHSASSLSPVDAMGRNGVLALNPTSLSALSSSSSSLSSSPSSAFFPASSRLNDGPGHYVQVNTPAFLKAEETMRDFEAMARKLLDWSTSVHNFLSETGLVRPEELFAQAGAANAANAKDGQRPQREKVQRTLEKGNEKEKDKGKGKAKDKRKGLETENEFSAAVESVKGQGKIHHTALDYALDDVLIQKKTTS